MGRAPGHGGPGLKLSAIFIGQACLFATILALYDGPSFLTAFSVGFDYPFYYRAAQLWVHGLNPYPQISALPLSIVSGLLFVWMPMHAAFRAYQVLNLVLVLVSMAWFCRKIGLTLGNTLSMMVVTVTYGPFLYLVEGGNADGIMLALLIAACCIENTAARAVLLAISAWTKLYSLLAVAVLAIGRRWRLVGITVAAILLIAIPYVPLLAGANTAVNERIGWFKFTGNISPAMLFALLAGLKHPAVWRSMYLLFWGGTLVAMLAGKRDRTVSETITDCLPWMAAAPALVNIYAAVILLPVGARLLRASQDRQLGNWERLSLLGFTLAGLYPLAFVTILPLTEQMYSQGLHLFGPVGAIGVTLLLIGTSADRLTSSKC